MWRRLRPSVVRHGTCQDGHGMRGFGRVIAVCAASVTPSHALTLSPAHVHAHAHGHGHGHVGHVGVHVGHVGVGIGRGVVCAVSTVI